MIIKHILKFFALGAVVALPFGLVTISNNYKIVSKKDDQSLNSVNPSSLSLNSVDLDKLSLLSNNEIHHNIYITEKNLSSNLLISDLSTLDFGLYQNSLISSDKNIYISIDEQGDIDKEIALISNELNELNEQLEKELLVSSSNDLQNDDKNIYISVDEQGNIDQERTVVDSAEEQIVVANNYNNEQIAVVESYKEPLINQDTETDKVLIKIENIDGKIVQTVVNRERSKIVKTPETIITSETDKTLKTAIQPNSYRDIAINERDIYSSLDEVDNKGKVSEKIIVAKDIDNEELTDKKSVLETAFAKIDTVDDIDVDTVDMTESIDVAQVVDKVEPVKTSNQVIVAETFEQVQAKETVNQVEPAKIATTKTTKTTIKPVETVRAKEVVNQVERTKIAKTTKTTIKPVETELVVSSDAEILGNDIELYSKTDILDTTAIEMIAYNNYMTEDKNVENNVAVEEVNTNVASTDTNANTEAETKELQIAKAKAKAKKLQVALVEAKAKKLQLVKAEELRVAEAKKIKAREYEEGLINLASAGNITQEFASLSPSLVNRSLSIDLSVGREDIETPPIANDIENINTDLVLTDSLIEQKKKIEVIIVDRRNISVKDENFYYSKKSIPTIPTTVLDSTVKGVKTEKLRILELGRGFKSSSFISGLYSSRQCR